MVGGRGGGVGGGVGGGRGDVLGGGVGGGRGGDGGGGRGGGIGGAASILGKRCRTSTSDDETPLKKLRAGVRGGGIRGVVGGGRGGDGVGGPPSILGKRPCTFISVDQRPLKKRKLNPTDILDLPDDILIDIAGRLDMRDGIRTTAVCPQFRSIWLRAPLDLDGSTVKQALRGNCSRRELGRILGKVADCHGGPIRSISFSFFWLDVLLNQFIMWREEGRFRCLDALSLNFTGERWGDNMVHEQYVPRDVFQLDTLRSVSLRNCFVRLGDAFSSKRLSLLELRNVTGQPGTIQHIVKTAADCSRVDTLILAGSPYSDTLIIEKFELLQKLLIFLRPDASEGAASNSEDVVSNIFVRNNANLKELYITQSAYGPYLIVTDVPELKFCGSLGWCNRVLEISGARFMRTTAMSLVAQLASVKIFCLQILRPNAQKLRDFLHCFPRLETLHIKKISTIAAPNLRAIRDDGPGMLPDTALLECMEETLSEVILWEFSSVPTELCNFFLSRGRVLDCLTLVGVGHFRYPRINEQAMQNLLQGVDLNNIASAVVALKFCYDKHVAGYDDSITLQTTYDSDPCKVRLGAEFYVLTLERAEEAAASAEEEAAASAEEAASTEEAAAAS